MIKKHNWLSYGRSGDTIEIGLFDQTGRKIDSFKTNNKEEYPKILKIIKEKYEFNPEEEVEVSKEKAESLKESKDVDWLK